MTTVPPSAVTPTPPPRRVLVDTNVLLRAADSASPEHATAHAAVAAQLAAKSELCITPQNLVEFWAVATRPLAVNGLGWASAQAATEVQALRAAFTLIPDSPDVFPQWERLAVQYGVQGKQAHDCRLVAFMLVHGITHLLTFNAPHFRRYEAPEGIAVIDPASVLAAPSDTTAT